MIRPVDIPEDVWRLAMDCATDMSVMMRDPDVEFIARTILKDRAGRINTHGLTEMQADCLRYIVDHQRAHDGITPSFEEIRAALDLGSRSGVMRLLDALEERGRISRLAHRARSITIIANPAN